MKLHYSKILLLYLPLNILVSSSYAHNKNKPYIKLHKRTTTSRVLRECDIQTSIYDNDAEMKAVMDNYNRQTSARFKKYDERMIKKRQKCKEQCDKDIQQIIVKDKVKKSLEKKVEEGCLMCGCGLGGGVAPVWGIVSGLWYATWKQYVTQAPIQKGIDTVISQIDYFPGINTLPGFNLANVINPNNYTSGSLIVKAIDAASKPMCGVRGKETLQFCNFTSHGGRTLISQLSDPAERAARAGIEATATEAAKLAKKSLTLTNTISASFVAIVVIVLVMLIIYLILRYRRKKKINKKQQYTKLLNK
ncbi:PIR protein, putative [Plasmodium sp. gorilla clade G1]|nr:PIR protein, putative [Plasmodium sp. gorilla clade G1]